MLYSRWKTGKIKLDLSGVIHIGELRAGLTDLQEYLDDEERNKARSRYGYDAVMCHLWEICVLDLLLQMSSQAKQPL